MKFKKAPAYEGKVLTLFIGGGDKRVADGEILEGAYWRKFIEQGFLVPVEEGVKEVKKEPVKVEAKKEEKKESDKQKSDPIMDAISEIRSSSCSFDDDDKDGDKKDDASAVMPSDQGGMTKSTADKMSKMHTKKKKSQK